MRMGMLSLAIVMFTLPAGAGMPTSLDRLAVAPISLLERALAAPQAAQDRPTGQCIYECGERLITLKRCPDGDCPEFDCQTGTATCRTR